MNYIKVTPAELDDDEPMLSIMYVNVEHIVSICSGNGYTYIQTVGVRPKYSLVVKETVDEIRLKLGIWQRPN